MNIEVTQVSTATAKQRLSEIINQVAYGGRRIVITSRGRPRVGLVGLDDLEQLGVSRSMLDSRKQDRRLKALTLADRIREEISKGGKMKGHDPVTVLHRIRQERDQHLIGNLH